jgi:hypothetical protein
MSNLISALARGAAAGLVAGIPQVLATQAEARLLGLPGDRADIGPRFVERVANHLDTSAPEAARWTLAAAFHFGYSVWWGALYALLEEWRPAQPHVGGPLLGALIYAVAFSPWGAATQTRTEGPVETRQARETLLHWTAALSFSLITAYLYARLDPRRPEDAARGARGAERAVA